MASFIKSIKKKIIKSSHEICGQCNHMCSAMHFQQNFKNWTSGNNDIDEFIQDAQLSVHSDDDKSKVLEWIPYSRFNDIKYIAKDGIGKVYRANWIDGYIQYWDSENQNWKRERQNMFVIL